MSGRRPGTRRPRVRGRRPPAREGLPRILILCEAARTEPDYFRALARDLNLPNVLVRTPKRGQWGPRGISTAAEQEGEQDSDLDEIWCVLDHDERDADIEGFCSWLARQPHGEAGTVTVRAAISVPCFEYWLLLHFRYTNRSFRGTLGGPDVQLESFIVSNTPSSTMRRQWGMEKDEMQRRNVLFQEEDKDSYVGTMLRG